MPALLLTLVLFLFLMLLGKAILVALNFKFPILRSWLLAPSIGLAAIVLLVLNLNQAGLPIGSFASWLIVVLSVFIIGVFWRRRPVWPWKQLGAIVAIAMVALAYTCWPMFFYGFRWVGYLNADMGTYCLDALRTMHTGFYRVPTRLELMGRDYSLYFWFHYAVGLFRCGGDLFLGWVASVTGTEPIRVSMPVVGATNMAEIFAGVSLVLVNAKARRSAILTGCLLAVSPLMAFGAMAQLLPQISGLALLFSLCALCMRPLAYGREAIWKSGLLIALVGTACCICYPEVLPFGALAIAAYHGFQVIRRRQALRPAITIAGAIAALFILIARQTLLTAIGTVLFIVSATKEATGATDFDTVLDPSMFASMFGIQLYYGARSDPWTSLAILLGAVLFFAAVVIAARHSLQGRPIAFLLLVMLCVGGKLFQSHSAFGVFKLFMYGQLVLLYSVAVFCLWLAGKRYYLAAGACYLIATAWTGYVYIAGSTDFRLEESMTLPHIVRADVRNIKLPQDAPTIVDTPNMSGDFLIAAAGVGSTLEWADYNIFRAFSKPLISEELLRLPGHLGLTGDYVSARDELGRIVQSTVRQEYVLGHFFSQTQLSPDVKYLGHLAHDPWHVSNNDVPGSDDGQYFVFHPLEKERNHIVLHSTHLGGVLLRSNSVSEWPVEPDLYRPGDTFYAVGRYMLFEVIQPTPAIRVRISLSRSLMGGGGRTALPVGAQVGATSNQRLPLLGSGSANVISEPLRLVERDGHFYFALDFGIEGSYFAHRKTGLMRLFKVDMPIDPRKPVAFVRDLSVLTEQDYQAVVRPRRISKWPAGLLSENVEFSGIYEDGWISDRAFVVLGKAQAGDRILIKGMMPHLAGLADGNRAKVLLNGASMWEGVITPGRFFIEGTAAAETANTRLDFVFEKAAQLPSGDDRPVSAQLLDVAIIDGASRERRGAR